MDVNMNQVNNYNTLSTLLDTDTSQDTNQNTTTTGTSTSVNAGEAAIYESTANKNIVYKPDYDTIQKMLKENDEKVNSFRLLMEKIFNKQGLSFNRSIEELKSVLSKDGTKLNMDIDEGIRKKAEEEIGEDGYWGVDQTATRITDFAKALSGGDPSKIETLRKAVQGGFKAAEKQWGGKLPEISQKTYDEVMKRFDKWAESYNTDTDVTDATLK